MTITRADLERVRILGFRMGLRELVHQTCSQVPKGDNRRDDKWAIKHCACDDARAWRQLEKEIEPLYAELLS